MSDPKPFEAVRDYGQQHMGWPEVPDEKPVDHANEARKHIEWAHEQQSKEGEYDTTVRDNAILAQAEATLALVEQQRIANIIAFQGVTGESYRAEVRAALGLKS